MKTFTKELYVSNPNFMSELDKAVKFSFSNPIIKERNGKAIVKMKKGGYKK